VNREASKVKKESMADDAAPAAEAAAAADGEATESITEVVDEEELARQKAKEEKQKAKDEEKLKKAAEKIQKKDQKTQNENVIISLGSSSSPQSGCVQILKTGKNKGTQCGCKISQDGLCGRHYKLLHPVSPDEQT
jgi:hypothetical protein